MSALAPDLSLDPVRIERRLDQGSGGAAPQRSDLGELDRRDDLRTRAQQNAGPGEADRPAPVPAPAPSGSGGQQGPTERQAAGGSGQIRFCWCRKVTCDNLLQQELLTTTSLYLHQLRKKVG